MINKLLSKIIRIGRVKTIYPERATVRVQFDDLSGIQSAELQVIMRRTEKDTDYDMFTIDEQVLCLFLPIARNTGFVIGSIYTVTNVPGNFAENNMKAFKFEDGTEVSYDRKNKLFKLHSVGDIEISATNIRVEAAEKLNFECETFELNARTNADIITPTLTITGNTIMSGTLDVGGLIKTDTDLKTPAVASQNEHAHQYVDAFCGGPATKVTTPPTG